MNGIDRMERKDMDWEWIERETRDERIPVTHSMNCDWEHYLIYNRQLINN